MTPAEQARLEIDFCQTVLAKSGLSVLDELFRDTAGSTAWTHYPDPDVYDPASGAQWFYHSHGKQQETAGPEAEHGHFHCFLRPDGAEGPIHHLIALGVDAFGRPLRLFSVNQWVSADDWLDAAGTAALLMRFDVQLARPSYLLNRWLTAHLVAYEKKIVELIEARDRVLSAHPANARADRSLEVLSEWFFD